MMKTPAGQLRKRYGIALSIILIITGICLMAACLHIYQGGDGVFSREIVAEHFAGIAVLVYLCLGMIVLGFVLDLFLPHEKKKSAAKGNHTPSQKQTPGKQDHSCLRWVILVAAVIILVYGYMHGGTADVLTKAINICTECVGLG